MREITLLAFAYIASIFKCRAALCAENLALFHQLCVFHRSVKRANPSKQQSNPAHHQFVSQ